jgi:hypothetical protein
MRTGLLGLPPDAARIYSHIPSYDGIYFHIPSYDGIHLYILSIRVVIPGIYKVDRVYDGSFSVL